MMGTGIHPSAVIHPTALVEPGAEVGAGCDIRAYAVVTRFCILGEGVVVHPFAVIGGDPQFLKFDPATPSRVRIGARSVLREHVTVNRSIHAGRETVIGENCFMMAASHAGHDCEVGAHVVFANGALLAGHVQVGVYTFLGGGAAVHQFCRIGESVMVAGHASITRDVPPFTMVAERDALVGCNLVGLRRRGFTSATIAEIKALYRDLFLDGGNPRASAATRSSTTTGSDEAQRFLDFFATGKRGFARARRVVAAEAGEAAD